MEPIDRPLWIDNASLPAALVETPLPGPVSGDGLVRASLRLEEGRIAAILAPGAGSGGAGIDMDGGQVWPCFVDLHTHLDKGHIWPRAPSTDGTLDSARAITRADTIAHWRAADVRARFEFGLRCAYAHGTAAIRTHLDCGVPGQAETAFAVFSGLREAWAGRIEVQGVAMTTLDVYQTARGVEIADLAQRSGGLLGGIARRFEDQAPEVLDGQLDTLIGLAAARGLDIDLHVDETGDVESVGLQQVARAALRGRFGGRITCGHCCSLGLQDEAVVGRSVALAREAGLAVVSLPIVNLFLQGRRAGATPRWRGVTALHQLRQGGVTVAVASDNCRDPFHMAGDQDMLEVFREAVRIGHLDLDIGAWAPAATRAPAGVMGVRHRGVLKVGAAADLVLFRGRSMSELLARPQADRVVLRDGVRIDRTLPDHRELDGLFGGG